MTLTTPAPTPAAEAFAGRILTSVLGSMECASIVLGDRLGWYRALTGAGSAGLSGGELAAATGTHERYAREWLEQQAVSGIVEVTGDAELRRFVLPQHAAEVLSDPSSLAFMAPLPRMVAASVGQLPRLLDAYRTGGGVSWAEFGDEARESQGDANRPIFEGVLADALAGVDRVHTVLSRPGARIVDVACGHGWSTIALARAYPEAEVVGVDVDGPSIDAARRHAAEVGMAERLSFQTADAAGLSGMGRFDGAFVFEALHDMPYPVPVLTAVRESLTPDGVAVVMDEAVADAFAPDGDETERLMYGYSILICLPDSMSAQGSVATGTVIRAETVDRYAREAGFSGARPLPIEDFGFFRFYELTR